MDSQNLGINEKQLNNHKIEGSFQLQQCHSKIPKIVVLIINEIRAICKCKIRIYRVRLLIKNIITLAH